MSSKQVIDRERTSRGVIARLEECTEAARSGGEEVMTPHLGRGERVPDLVMFLVLLGRMLRAAIEGMIAADRVHEQELADDAAVRASRDRAHAACYALVVSIRKLIEAGFGDVGLKTLSLWDPCPNDPQGTLSYARSLAAALASDTDLGAPRIRSVRLDRAALAAELGGLCDALDREIGRVASEDGAAKTTQAQKDAAIAAHDRALRNATQLGVAVLQLAGHDALAERVRPTVRRERSEPEPEPAQPDAE